ncbi:MAG: 2-dehydro-3-deoxy-6-phosphogalactonate aldolase [Rhizobiales bacterium]|nr:2-dehydro-3-deoxy-6-phosphogalactonate aldolase [Hyphomicrobiales bacterium]
MNWLEQFSRHRGIIAILRGVQPNEVEDIAEALIAAGITLIEVPLNSPDPFDSIEKLVKLGKDRALVGAGTVLATYQVDKLADIGAQLVVSPNTNSAVIQRTKARGLMSMPGVFTATDAFNALEAGADVLKFFPADSLGPSGLSAVKAVLPKNTVLAAVGGVGESSFSPYLQKGITGFGIGGSLYKPGRSIADVSAIAKGLVAAYDKALSQTC